MKSDNISWILIEFWPHSDLQKYEWYGRSARAARIRIKAGKGKGAVGVTVTNATKNYIVLLKLEGYSEVSYIAKVVVP